jgi:exonuclease 3'-5' domain-containing protein 1
LEQYGPGTEVPIKSLLGHRSQAPPEVRHVSGQHIKEFRDFLAKHTDDFVVRDDDIIYLKKYEGCITSRFSETNDDSLSNVDIPTPKLDPRMTNQLLSNIRELLESRPDLPVIDLYAELMPTLDQSLPIKKHQDLLTFLKMHSHLFRVNAGTVTLIPIPKQNHLSSPTRTLRTEGSPQNSQQQSLKQRVNSEVLKALADNSDRDKAYPPMTTAASTSTCTPIACSSIVDNAALRTSIFQRTRVIITSRESNQVMEEILRRGEAVALDCEGINLSTPKGQIALLQLSTMSGQAYLLDVATDPKMWVEGKVQAVLECNDVAKVLHDCRNISSVLHAQHGINLSHVFDAQVL